MTAIISGTAGYMLGKNQGASSSPVSGAMQARGTGQGSDQSGKQSGRGRFRGNMVSGTVLSMDATGITVRLDDGTSRIVFIGAKTEVAHTIKADQS